MKNKCLYLGLIMLSSMVRADPPRMDSGPFLELLNRISHVAAEGNLADPHYVSTALQCQNVEERHVPAQRVREEDVPPMNFGYLISGCPLPQASGRAFLYTNKGADNTQPGKVSVSLSPFDDGTRLPLQKVFDLAEMQFGKPKCQGDEDSAQYCVFKLKGQHNASLLILGMHGVLMNIALQN